MNNHKCSKCDAEYPCSIYGCQCPEKTGLCISCISLPLPPKAAAKTVVAPASKETWWNL